MPGSNPLGSIANDIVTAFFEDKVNLPAAPQVDLAKQQGIATRANIDNLAADQELAGKVNTFNFDQIQSMLRKAIPGYDQLVSKQRGIIDSELNGELPQDVQDAIQRNAATRSVAGGYAGSGMARNLTARDLGLTSLALTNQGLDSASRWLSQMKSTALPSMFNLTSMFITPEQQAQNEWKNQISSYERNAQQNIIDVAKANRETHAIADLGADTVSLVLSAYTGGMMNADTVVGQDDYGNDVKQGFSYTDMLNSFMGKQTPKR